jgi:hypothetical protein
MGLLCEVGFAVLANACAKSGYTYINDLFCVALIFMLLQNYCILSTKKLIINHILILLYVEQVPNFLSLSDILTSIM